MMTEETLRGPMWKALYEVAMLESDWAKLPPLLNDAIDSVLDMIEETQSQGELEELNKALNGLRLRRKEISSPKRGQADNTAPSKAA
jgi:hypothetical protein